MSSDLLDVAVPPAAIEGAGNDATLSNTPFKELNYYERADRDRFAGREADIQKVVAHIETERTLVLYGRSGLGKTSLLLAGVFPQLEADGFRTVYVRTLENPLCDLASAIIRDCKLPSDSEPQKIKSLLARAGDTTRIVLVFDQFEEFFLRFQDQKKERGSFVRELSNLITDAENKTRVVFSLREDHLAALDEFQHKLPDLFLHSYRLAPLTAFGAREAIVRPLQHEKVLFDERLVTRLVDELAKFSFDSARLQVTCAEVYRAAKQAQEGELHLTEGDLERLTMQLGTRARLAVLPPASPTSQTTAGSDATSFRLLEGVFQRYLQRAIEPAERYSPVLARSILDVMITQQETKYALSRADLLRLELGPFRQVIRVLTSLRKHGLVRRQRRGKQPWYELIHECLVPEILEWLKNDDAFRQFRAARSLITDLCRNELWREEPNYLLSQGQLRGVVRPTADRLRLDPTQTEFVLRSAIYRRTEDIDVWWKKFCAASSPGRDPAEGAQAGRELLLRLLRDKDHEVRRGAAGALAACDDRHSHLLEACEELTLSEKEPTQVRRAAGRSLAKLGNEALIIRLQKRLRIWRTPKPVIELLADLHGTVLLQRLNRWWRWRARHHADWRHCKEHAELIRENARRGAVHGLIAGLGWPLTCGLLAAICLNWVANPVPEMSPVTQLVYYFGWTLPIGLGLGAVVGSMIGRAIARSFAKTGYESWGRSVRGSRALGFVLSIPLFLLSTLFLLDGGFPATRLFRFSGIAAPFILAGSILAGSICVALILRLALALGAHCLRRCFTPASPISNALVWATITGIANFTITVLCPIILIGIFLGRTYVDRGVMHWMGFAFLAAMVLNFLLYVTILTLARWRIAAPETAETSKVIGERTHRRRLVGLTALAAPVMFLGAYGWHATPFSPKRSPKLSQTADEWNTDVRLRLWPDIQYFQLRNNEPVPALVHLEFSRPIRLTAERQSIADVDNTTVFAPRGQVDLSISNLFTFDSNATAAGPLELTARLIPIGPELPKTLDISDTTKYFRWKIEQGPATPKIIANVATDSSVSKPQTELDNTDAQAKPGSAGTVWRAKLSGGWPAGQVNRMKLTILRTPPYQGSLPQQSYQVYHGNGLEPLNDVAWRYRSSERRARPGYEDFEMKENGTTALYRSIEDPRESLVFRVKPDQSGDLNAQFSIVAAGHGLDDLKSAELILGFTPYAAEDFIQEMKSSDLQLEEKIQLGLNARDFFPANAEILGELADLFSAEDRLADLSKLIHLAVAAGPQEIKLLRICSEGLAKCREFAQATVMARQVVKLEPNNPENLDTLAWRLIDQGNYSEAVDSAKMSVTSDRDGSKTLTYAYALLRAKRYAEASSAASDAVVKSEKANSENPSFHAAMLKTIAWSMFDRRFEVDVLSWARKAVELNGSDSDGVRKLVELLVGFDQDEAALDVAVKAVEHARDNADFLRIQSWALANIGRPKEALEVARKAAQAKPSDEKTAQNLTWRLLENNEPAEALACIQKIRPKGPNSPDLLSAKTSALVANKKVSDAVDLAREEVTKHPNDQRYLTRLAWALSRDHKHNEALNEARRATGIAADSQYPPLLDTLAHRLADAEQFDEAIKIARQILGVEPEESTYWRTMAAVLNRAGQYQEAYKWAQKAVTSSPRTASYRSELAQAAYGLGRWAQAVENWTKAIEYNPAQFSTCYSLNGEKQQRNFEEAKRKINRP